MYFAHFDNKFIAFSILTKFDNKKNHSSKYGYETKMCHKMRFPDIPT